MESGRRAFDACDGECPWERVTPFSIGVWNLFAVAVESWEDQKKKETHYNINVERMRFALVMEEIAESSWKHAWRWLSFAVNEANRPSGEMGTSGEEETDSPEEEL